MTLVTMNVNEVSMLSDDLRPRDTPNNTLFKDFVLKPIVPDLSITEESPGLPRSEEHRYDATLHSSHSSGQRQQRPLLEECKTYSEWRKKSNQNMSVSPASNSTQNNSYNQYIGLNLGGMTRHTVLDNLNSSSTPQALDKQSFYPTVKQTSRRKSGGYGSSTEMIDETSKKSPNQKEIQAVHSKMTRRESLHGLTERETHSFDAPVKCSSRKSNSRSDSDSSMGHHLPKNSKHFNGHREVINCAPCSCWSHQPTAPLGCNSIPNCHSFPHGGLPSCSTVLRNLRVKPVSTTSPASTNASRNLSTNPHSCGDSILYDNLYQIVLSQSEQLRALQTQVEKLLISQEHKHNSNFENSRTRCQRLEHCSCNATLSEKSTQTSDTEININDNEKMSIGVMTSFVHTVAYAGRMEVLDSRCKGTNQANMNMSAENRKKMQNGNTCSTSTSPPSQPMASTQSSMRSTTPSPPQIGCQKRCCKWHNCAGNSPGEKTSKKKQMEVPDKNSKLDQLEEALGNKKPGVSAAIRAVRGCQEVLATLSNGGDDGRPEAAEVDESITFNGVDLPTVVEPPISPPSSIHVDMQDYHSSSSDQDESSSSDDENSSSDGSDHRTQGQTQNGWTFYQSVLGQVNQLLEDKGPGKRKTRKERKDNRKRETHSDAVQVNSVLKRVAFQQESKRAEDDSVDSFKQLALNYLRENHPEELASSKGYTGIKTSGAHRRVQDVALYNVGNNMSFATFRYLERYNLLPENFKINRIEELPGYTGDVQNVDNRPMLTNGPLENNRSPFGKRTQNAIGAHGQQLNAGPSNGIDFSIEDRANRAYMPHHKENRNARPAMHKQSSKPRHKRHLPQTNLGNPIPVAGSHGQQSGPGPAYKILDITALRQQPKLL